MKDVRGKRIESGKWLGLIFLLSSFFVSCTSQPNTPTQTVTINYSPFTEFQVNEVYACANDLAIQLNVTDQSPEITFQFGEPKILSDYAYQVGEEELVVVVNRQSEIQELSQAEVQNFFGTQAMQVWVYAEGENLQQVFDQVAMQGRSVSSFAKVAPNPQILIEVLSADANAIGFIPKSIVNENLKTVYSLGSFPILAVTETEPQGALKNLIGCLQK